MDSSGAPSKSKTLAERFLDALQNARLFDETQRLFKAEQQRAAELAVINSIQQGMAGSAAGDGKLVHDPAPHPDELVLGALGCSGQHQSVSGRIPGERQGRRELKRRG